MPAEGGCELVVFMISTKPLPPAPIPEDTSCAIWCSASHDDAQCLQCCCLLRRGYWQGDHWAWIAKKEQRYATATAAVTVTGKMSTVAGLQWQWLTLSLTAFERSNASVHAAAQSSSCSCYLSMWWLTSLARDATISWSQRLFFWFAFITCLLQCLLWN